MQNDEKSHLLSRISSHSYGARGRNHTTVTTETTTFGGTIVERQTSSSLTKTLPLLDFSKPIRLLHSPSAYYQDIYYWLMKINITTFFLSCLLLYSILAIIFATFFYPQRHCMSPPIDGYWELFLFHVTFLTGLGSSHAGTNVYLQVVFSIESLLKVLLFSLTTGLIYVRFTKPIARIRFAKYAVITNHRGQRKFMFRVLHERQESLINVHVDVVMSLMEIGEDGRPWRSFRTLQLQRNNIPAFSLPWTVMHVIDQDSPLSSMTPEDFLQGSCQIIVTMRAVEQVMSAAIHARHDYYSHDLIFDKMYENMIENIGDVSYCNLAKMDSIF